jgi:hypothetical protein
MYLIRIREEFVPYGKSCKYMKQIVRRMKSDFKDETQ